MAANEYIAAAEAKRLIDLIIAMREPRTLWNRAHCSLCGINGKPYVIAQVATGIPDCPFTETVMCENCYETHGIEPAIHAAEDIQKEFGRG